MDRQLLIALVKDANTDRILSVNERGAALVRLDPMQAVGKPSAQLWPDDGTHYREHDREVAEQNTPKLNIHEFVIVNGKPVDVITEKYPIQIEGNVNPILVLVFRKNGKNTDYGARYSVARVKCSDSWTPSSADEIPDFEPRDVDGFVVAAGESNISLMPCDEAIKKRNELNQKILESNSFTGMWHVVLPPGYDPLSKA